MKKNTIVTVIFLVLMVVAALLFVFLSGEKDSIFWISLITTELSLFFLGGAATLYYSQNQFNKKMKSRILSCAVYYAVAAAIINVLFSRFIAINTSLYVAIHILLVILICFIFMTSVLLKKKKRHNRNKLKEVRTTGIPSLLLEIQELESSVSRLNQEIQIDIESMLLSLDKEVRYVNIPEGEEGESFQIYLKEKISDLTPIMNELIETQGENTQPFSKMIIDLKYLLDNPESAPRRTVPSLETPKEDEPITSTPSSNKKITSDEKEKEKEMEMDAEIPISIPLKSIDLELPKTPNYKEITDFADLEEIPEASNDPRTKKEGETPEPVKTSKTSNAAKTVKTEESSTAIDEKKELAEKKREKRGFFGRRKSKHPTEEELQAQVDEFFGRTPVKEEFPQELQPEEDVFLPEQQEASSAFSEEQPLNKNEENTASYIETPAEESIADTFKAKISEIEDLAKKISSFEDLKRSPDEENKEKDGKEE